MGEIWDHYYVVVYDASSLGSSYKTLPHCDEEHNWEIDRGESRKHQVYMVHRGVLKCRMFKVLLGKVLTSNNYCHTWYQNK